MTVQLPFAMQTDETGTIRGALPLSAQLVFSEPFFSEQARYAVFAHADGSLVTGAHPAHGGEEIVLYAFGLGGTTATPSIHRPSCYHSRRQRFFIHNYF